MNSGSRLNICCRDAKVVLVTSEKLGSERTAAMTYHQLGRIAERRRDFEQAEEWCRKSLAIDEKQENEHGEAIMCQQLGLISLARRDFDRAEQWYLKSLAIEEKQGIEYGAASTYGQLGILAGERGHFEQAGQWIIQIVQTFLKRNDEHRAAIGVHNFAIFCRRAPAEQAAKLRAMWEQAGLPPLPDPGP
jgi:tetratricopeptide (TPR) repeat protein